MMEIETMDRYERETVKAVYGITDEQLNMLLKIVAETQHPDANIYHLLDVMDKNGSLDKLGIEAGPAPAGN